MYIEYCNYNKPIQDYELEQTNLFIAIDKGINGIAIPIYMLKKINDFLPNSLVCSVPIDFPLGYSSSKSRLHMVSDALNSGANAIDLTLNNYLLKENYRKLKSEIQTILGLCKNYNATLRILLEYNYSTNIITTAKFLENIGVEYVFTSLGYHYNDFEDNLLNGYLVADQTNLNIIFSGYVWKDDQIDRIKESNFFGHRVYSLKFLV